MTTDPQDASAASAHGAPQEQPRWETARQACGHLFNWSPDMTEWTHHGTQSPNMHSIVKQEKPWFWIPAEMACERTDYLNALEADLKALRTGIRSVADGCGVLNAYADPAPPASDLLVGIYERYQALRTENETLRAKAALADDIAPFVKIIADDAFAYRDPPSTLNLHNVAKHWYYRRYERHNPTEAGAQ